jgi:Protein of unknown function (DUF1573)
MKVVRRLCAFTFASLLSITAAAQEKHSPNQPNAGTSTAGAPLLVIESLTHDFGEVKAGTPLRYAFIVKNQGKADLLINNVAPG